MAKSKTVKFEVGQLVKFSGNRVGQVSRIAKNGAVYVSVLGETTVANQTREELRVKKADLQLVNDVLERTRDAVSVEDYIRHVIRDNISYDVVSNAERAEAGVYKLAQDYIPSPGCLEYCEWEGSKVAQRVLHNFGIDLVKLANLYTGKREAPDDNPQSKAAGQVIEEPASESSEAVVNAAQEIVADVHAPQEPAQSSLDFPTEPKEESQSVALANAAYALRELTFSVTRHSILTAFIDVARNKNIPGYHHQVAGNIKNLMEAAFDPVQDARGYARINTWMWAALKLLVKNKERIAKMLNQPIETAPIQLDRVTKLGLWLDKNMDSNGAMVNDLTAAYDSCYMYNAIGKKLEAYTFVVVEVAQARANAQIVAHPIPSAANQEFCEYLTAQSAIAVRKQYIDRYRHTEPDLHLYCGIVPVYKTGLAMQAAVEDVLASAIDGLK